MKFIKQLPTVEELQALYPITPEQSAKRLENISQIKAILTGEDTRKLVFVGPCSADREDAVLKYTTRLASLAEQLREKLLIIPRIYTSKPRTNGIGYK